MIANGRKSTSTASTLFPNTPCKDLLTLPYSKEVRIKKMLKARGDKNKHK
jgi:hypothetical protein